MNKSKEATIEGSRRTYRKNLRSLPTPIEKGQGKGALHCLQPPVFGDERLALHITRPWLWNAPPHQHHGPCATSICLLACWQSGQKVVPARLLIPQTRPVWGVLLLRGKPRNKTVTFVGPSRFDAHPVDEQVKLTVADIRCYHTSLQHLCHRGGVALRQQLPWACHVRRIPLLCPNSGDLCFVSFSSPIVLQKPPVFLGNWRTVEEKHPEENGEGTARQTSGQPANGSTFSGLLLKPNCVLNGGV